MSKRIKGFTHGGASQEFKWAIVVLLCSIHGANSIEYNVLLDATSTTLCNTTLISWHKPMVGDGLFDLGMIIGRAIGHLLYVPMETYWLCDIVHGLLDRDEEFRRLIHTDFPRPAYKFFGNPDHTAVVGVRFYDMSFISDNDRNIVIAFVGPKPSYAFMEQTVAHLASGDGLRIVFDKFH